MILEKLSLTGKVAVVTGGSRGIGRAVALGLAEAGADVVVSSRNLEACQTVAQQVEALGRRSLAVSCDVGHEERVEALFAATMEKFGRVDVLVNSAGVAIYNSALKMPLADWDAVVRVNLTGSFLCARTAARYMAKQGGGSIINISSTTAHAGGLYVCAYAASKAGVEGLTRQLAIEWAKRKVRVNCVVFGIVETDMLAEAMQDETGKQRLFDRTPMRRAALPEETVGAILLMAADASSFMTGAVVPVDGGWCAG